jgi:hypothetical protein
VVRDDGVASLKAAFVVAQKEPVALQECAACSMRAGAHDTCKHVHDTCTRYMYSRYANSTRVINLYIRTGVLNICMYVLVLNTCIYVLVLNICIQGHANNPECVYKRNLRPVCLHADAPARRDSRASACACVRACACA